MHHCTGQSRATAPTLCDPSAWGRKKNTSHLWCLVLTTIMANGWTGRRTNLVDKKQPKLWGTKDFIVLGLKKSPEWTKTPNHLFSFLAFWFDPLNFNVSSVKPERDHHDHPHEESGEAVVADAVRSIKVDGITSGGPLVVHRGSTGPPLLPVHNCALRCRSHHQRAYWSTGGFECIRAIVRRSASATCWATQAAMWSDPINTATLTATL